MTQRVHLVRVHQWYHDEDALTINWVGKEAFLLCDRNIRSVKFTPTSDALLGACAGREMRLWNLVSGTELHRWSPPRDTIWAMLLSPDLRFLAFVSYHDGDILHVIDQTTRRECVRSSSYLSAPLTFEFSQHGKLLAAIEGLSKGQLYIWDLSTGKQVAHLSVGSVEPNAEMTFSPNERWLAVATNEDYIVLWDKQTHAARKLKDKYLGVETSLSFCGNGQWLAVALTTGKILILSTVTGRTERTIYVPGRGGQLAFSPDGSTLAYSQYTGDDRAATYLYDVQTGEIISQSDKAARSELAFSPDGQWLVGLDPTKMTLWKVQS